MQRHANVCNCKYIHISVSSFGIFILVQRLTVILLLLYILSIYCIYSAMHRSSKWCYIMHLIWWTVTNESQSVRWNNKVFAMSEEKEKESAYRNDRILFGGANIVHEWYLNSSVVYPRIVGRGLHEVVQAKRIRGRLWIVECEHSHCTSDYSDITLERIRI